MWIASPLIFIHILLPHTLTPPHQCSSSVSVSHNLFHYCLCMSAYNVDICVCVCVCVSAFDCVQNQDKIGLFYCKFDVPRGCTSHIATTAFLLQIVLSSSSLLQQKPRPWKDTEGYHHHNARGNFLSDKIIEKVTNLNSSTCFPPWCNSSVKYCTSQGLQFASSIQGFPFPYPHPLQPALVTMRITQ